LIKIAIHQKDFTITGNIYALNFGTPNFIKKTLLGTEAQITHITIVVDDLNIPLLPIHRSSRQKKSTKGYQK
jgi:protein involved in ribonucleotide reduction